MFIRSSKQSVIWKVSSLSIKTNLQSCYCFTSFSRGATRTLGPCSGSALVCATPCLSPRSGSFSGVDGAGRPSWLRTDGVTGADTGAFAVLSAALKSPCTSKYRTLHCRFRRIPLRIVVYMSRPRSQRQHAYCSARTPSRASLRGMSLSLSLYLSVVHSTIAVGRVGGHAVRAPAEILALYPQAQSRDLSFRRRRRS